MVYETPTTKEQMYEILKQIYYDYRMKIDGYEDAGLTDLILDRMEFTEKTEEELFEEARGLTIPWYDAELLKAKKTNEAKILALSKSLLSLDNEKEKRKTALESETEASMQKIQKEAIKKGYYNSDIMLQKIAKLESVRIEKLEEIESEFQLKTLEVNKEIDSLTEYGITLESDYEVYLENKINAKFLELKEKQESLKREVFQYNNGLAEKEKRSKNSNISANASLKLRYLEIRTKSYTKEELVDMGYYEEVINCVCGYYNTIANTAEAFAQFVQDTKVVIYLEDYYENVLAIYKARAGV